MSQPFQVFDRKRVVVPLRAKKEGMSIVIDFKR
jgi:hypothetical protein